MKKSARNVLLGNCRVELYSFSLLAVVVLALIAALRAASPAQPRGLLAILLELFFLLVPLLCLFGREGPVLLWAFITKCTVRATEGIAW